MSRVYFYLIIAYLSVYLLDTVKPILANPLPPIVAQNNSQIRTNLYAERMRQKTYEILDLQNIQNLTALANPNTDFYEAPNEWHTKGELHSQIYRAQFNSKPSLIKTIFSDSYAFMNDERFHHEVFAMLLASEIGGPEIYLAGRVKNDKGEIGYFIQMEEMFAEDPKNFTFKGWTFKPKFFRVFSQKNISKYQLYQIGQMLGLAVERGINIGLDNDFIFDSKGKGVRWLDTAVWTIEGHEQLDRPIYKTPDLTKISRDFNLTIHNYSYLVDRFFKIKESYGLIVLESLFSHILNSTYWSIPQKNQLIENFKYSLVQNWKLPLRLFDEAFINAQLKVQRNGQLNQKQSKSSSELNACRALFE